MVTRRGLIACVCILALALFAAGCGRDKNAQVGEDGLAVPVITASTADIDSAKIASGKLEALESANLVSKISGRVAKINVDLGSRVKAGDLLISLDAGELSAAVQVAEANLEKAKRSDLPALSNNARTTLATAEATYNNAEADYKRVKALKDSNAVSQQAYEQAEKAYLLAKSAYESAKQNLNIVENGTVPETIRLCQAQLAQARANYANSIINSPIDGVVTARYINPGELAGTSNPVLSVVNLDKVVVRVDVDESLINTLKEGAVVDVKVAAASKTPYKGTITNVALAASPTTKAYQVKIQISNPDHLLKPGMYAEVALTGQGGKGIILPRGVVLKSGDRETVWLISDGVAKKHEVKTSSLDDKNVLVLSGLSGGEKIISGKLDFLKEGAGVKPQEDKQN